MVYNCLHCFRTFAIPYALKRHISDKHQYDFAEDEGETSRSNIPRYEEPGLWDDLPIEEPGLWDDDLSPTEDQIVSSVMITIILKII
jgi:hypothetical protein